MCEIKTVCGRQKVLKQSFPANGFTLVELLIVLAIIAVLAAVSLSVVSQAREKANQAGCTRNLISTTTAMQQYVQDYDGVYPHVLFAYNINGVSTQVTWREVLSPYTGSRDLMRCPSQGKPLPGDYHGDGYDYNQERLNIMQWTGTTPSTRTLTVRGAEDANLPQPSTIWLNRDRIAVENHRCVDCESAKGSCGRTLYGSTVHNKGGNYSFLDGHIQWLTPNAIAELDCKNDPLTNGPPPIPGE